MNMYAINTNLLIYAHNTSSEFNKKAAAFLEKVMNEQDEDGRLSVCMPAQVVMEFIHVITWRRLEKPLLPAEAINPIEDEKKQSDYTEWRDGLDKDLSVEEISARATSIRKKKGRKEV